MARRRSRAEARAAERFEESDIASEFEDVIADVRVQLRGAEVRLELLAGLTGEPERPGDAGRTPEGDRFSDHVSRAHDDLRPLIPPG